MIAKNINQTTEDAKIEYEKRIDKMLESVPENTVEGVLVVLLKIGSVLRKKIVEDLKTTRSLKIGLMETLYRKSIQKQEKTLDKLNEDYASYDEKISYIIIERVCVDEMVDSKEKVHHLSLNQKKLLFDAVISPLMNQREIIRTSLQDLENVLSRHRNEASIKVGIVVGLITITVSVLLAISDNLMCFLTSIGKDIAYIIRFFTG